jgi:hypothetical protein
MARHPEWFERLDTIEEVFRKQDNLEWLGRNEIRALFGCSERDSIRLLHKFGATERDDALQLPRSALHTQLNAIRSGSAYAAFLRRREDVARQLSSARAETAARQFRVKLAAPAGPSGRLQDLPETITWRRSATGGPGRFEILYVDAADLMGQLAAFLGAAGAHREEFFAATEPPDGTSR